MALIFFGTPQFAVPSLRALIERGEDIAFVVTQPDRVKGRGHVLSPPPVKELALSKGARVLQPSGIKNNEEFLSGLKAAGPEFIIVVAYGKILPKEILAVPARGCVNVHASLLPKYRGAAPIQWALINGEKKTGITTMLMNEGMDTGDILLQEELPIRDEHNAGTLSAELSELGAKVLAETLRRIREGALRPVPQHGAPSFAPPLRKEDGKIDWNKSAEEICNLIKGVTPWPSAFCSLDGELVKILMARPVGGSGVPGRIEKASGGELVAGAGRGLLLIEELQPQGRKAMTAKAFLAGRKLAEKAAHGFS